MTLVRWTKKKEFPWIVELRCNEEKPQKKTQKSFLQENWNCDEGTVERNDKKVITIPDEGLFKEKEHYAINQIIKKYQKSSKYLCYICSESVKVKLNLYYCDFCRNLYHSCCAHKTCSFASTFPTNRYICQPCIENNYKSFHCYTSFYLSAELYSYIEDVDCISNLFDNWNKLPDNFKEDCKKVSIPMEHHHYGSPSQDLFLPIH